MFDLYLNPNRTVWSDPMFEYIVLTVIDNVLTTRQREIYYDYRVKNMSQVEIAKKYNITQPTVSRHISSSEDIIRHYLQIYESAKTLKLNNPTVNI